MKKTKSLLLGLSLLGSVVSLSACNNNNQNNGQENVELVYDEGTPQS